jgi:uncharacterized protein YbjT (DUF2867 family)
MKILPVIMCGGAGSAFRAVVPSAANLIKGARIPYTIVHSTQFFEFMGAIAQSGTVQQTVHLSPVYIQPIASDDVADAMADIALAAPVNGTIEIAGPERVRLSELVGRFLKATKDPRKVVADTHALYFGVKLNDQSLVPGDNPRIGATHFDDWLSQTTRQK